MNSEVYTNLKKMIDVNTPIIYIHDYDFTRVDFLLKQALGSETEILEWSPALGYQEIKCDEDGDIIRDKYGSDKKDLENVLHDFYNEEFLKEPTYLVLRDIQDGIETPKIKSLLQMIAQRKLYDVHFD
ncbi:MAG: hypothetical protein J6T70_17435, partial [Bacteroidales bacterium]|nr:hypothetical protein [Bacteroidales bacterium]